MFMNPLLKRYSMVLWLWLLCTAAQGQQILFRKYSVKDGLCSNTIWAIAQDRKGFMWFGTKNGLNRFDGYTFKSYRFNKEDAYSLGNNFIHDIAEYDDKNFWIATENGIYNLNLETERFTLAPLAQGKVVADIFRDSRGIMWATTRNNGLFGFRPADKKTFHFTTEPGNANSLSANQIRVVEEDKMSRLWIGTFGGGVDVLDVATMKFTHHKSPPEAGVKLNQTITLYRDGKGNMWAGTLGGLKQWRPGTDSAILYTTAEGLSDNIVRALYQPTSGKLYLGTEKGLDVWDERSQKFTSHTYKPSDPNSISDNSVYTIFPDREGGVWVGTFFGGLNYFPEKALGFELYYATGEKGTLSGNAVSCFLEDGPGRFWIGTENAGLNYFDSKSKTFNSYPFTPGQQPLSYHNIHALLKDDQGRLWVGTFSGGLNIYDPATGRVRQYRFNPSDTSSISSNNVFALHKDRQGQIWIGTSEGLSLYNPARDAFDRVGQLGLKTGFIYDIHEDNGGRVWFATLGGLAMYDKRMDSWSRYTADGRPGSLTSNRLNTIYDDGTGMLWLGTDGGGLNGFDTRTKTVKAYTEAQGISPIVYGILQDDKQNLWLSTINGIIQFSPSSEKVRVYNNLDDLQSPQFNYNAALKASDGKLYFGGISGFNAFHPDSLKEMVMQANPTITNFQLFNQDVPVSDGDGPLQKMIGFVDKLTLSHNQSVISFEYAAMSYRAPEKIQYAYIMEGFDKGWNYVGTQRKATYTNLPPGTYTFRVKSTDIYGNWNETSTAKTITVKPPFYRTPLAYVLYALTLAAGLFFVRRRVMEQTRKKNEERVERLQVQREKEFYNQKIEFFTTMAHEIRTPLSLIVAPLERLLTEEEWKPEVKEQLSVMNQNSDRLLNLVNQLLDFRRIESDIYTIRTEDVEIISFIHSLHSRFSAISYQKGIRFSMSTSINRLVVQADPEALTKILTNLLINAFKFAKGKVEVRVNEVEKHNGAEHFCISVTDDGTGIPADQLEKIFNPFYKVRSNLTANYSGTGIGLALAKSLTEKHGGLLKVQSRPQQETVFTLCIPYEAAAEATPIADSSTIVQETDEAKPVVLVVEDDDSLSDFVAKSLRGEGYKPITCSNGAEAMQQLEGVAVDLIISDVMMPEMDGIELCRQVKTNINFSHIPLILLTAKGNSDAEIAGIESGADAYITKPFKWKHLTVVVRNLLESRARLKNKFAQQPFVEVDSLATNSHDKEFVEKLIALIEERLTDPQLSVEDISRKMAMSRSVLHKKLKAISGHVPNEFVRLIRLKNAAKLLLSGGHSISEAGW